MPSPCTVGYCMPTAMGGHWYDKHVQLIIVFFCNGILSVLHYIFLQEISVYVVAYCMLSRYTHPSQLFTISF